MCILPEIADKTSSSSVNSCGIPGKFRAEAVTANKAKIKNFRNIVTTISTTWSLKMDYTSQPRLASNKLRRIAKHIVFFCRIVNK